MRLFDNCKNHGAAAAAADVASDCAASLYVMARARPCVLARVASIMWWRWLLAPHQRLGSHPGTRHGAKDHLLVVPGYQGLGNVAEHPRQSEKFLRCGIVHGLTIHLSMTLQRLGLASRQLLPDRVACARAPKHAIADATRLWPWHMEHGSLQADCNAGE